MYMHVCTTKAWVRVNTDDVGLVVVGGRGVMITLL